MGREETAATARQSVIPTNDDTDVWFKSINRTKSGKYTAYLGNVHIGSVLRSHGFWYYFIRDQKTGRIGLMHGPEATRKACGEQLRKAFHDGAEGPVS